MATCRVKGVPVKGATCSHIKCLSDECTAPDDHKCIHRDDMALREYTLTIRQPNGKLGRVVLQARSLAEATKRAGSPVVVGHKSDLWKQCDVDCLHCEGCVKTGGTQ